MRQDEMDLLLASVWREWDGRYWRTVAVVDQPAIIIQSIQGLLPKETHVITSPNFLERFTQLVPVERRA